MDWQSLGALFIATFILGLVPGPIVGALVGRALWGGLRATWGFLAGVFFGDLIWLFAAVFGLGLVAASYSTLFLIIKYVGAAYLIYLGLVTLFEVVRVGKGASVEIVKPKRRGASFLSGLFVTLGNPKLVAFYVGFLPTFIDIEALSFAEVGMAAIIVPTTFAGVNFGWALMASKARYLLKSSRPLQVLKGISGTMLIGAGVVMAREN